MDPRFMALQKMMNEVPPLMPQPAPVPSMPVPFGPVAASPAPAMPYPLPQAVLTAPIPTAHYAAPPQAASGTYPMPSGVQSRGGSLQLGMPGNLPGSRQGSFVPACPTMPTSYAVPSGVNSSVVFPPGQLCSRPGSRVGSYAPPVTSSVGSYTPLPPGTLCGGAGCSAAVPPTVAPPVLTQACAQYTAPVQPLLSEVSQPVLPYVPPQQRQNSITVQVNTPPVQQLSAVPVPVSAPNSVSIKPGEAQVLKPVNTLPATEKSKPVGPPPTQSTIVVPAGTPVTVSGAPVTVIPANVRAAAASVSPTRSSSVPPTRSVATPVRGSYVAPRATSPGGSSITLGGSHGVMPHSSRERLSPPSAAAYRSSSSTSRVGRTLIVDSASSRAGSRIREGSVPASAASLAYGVDRGAPVITSARESPDLTKVASREVTPLRRYQAPPPQPTVIRTTYDVLPTGYGSVERMVSTPVPGSSSSAYRQVLEVQKELSGSVRTTNADDSVTIGAPVMVRVDPVAPESSSLHLSRDGSVLSPRAEDSSATYYLPPVVQLPPVQVTGERVLQYVPPEG